MSKEGEKKLTWQLADQSDPYGLNSLAARPGREGSDTPPRDRVIVRAYGDEPVEMVIVKYLANHVEVARSETPLRFIGWPRSLMIPHSDEALAELREAWASGDTERLRATWRKYQDARRAPAGEP